MDLQDFIYGGAMTADLFLWISIYCYADRHRRGCNPGKAPDQALKGISPV
jgi:hypothetical protein